MFVLVDVDVVVERYECLSEELFVDGLLIDLVVNLFVRC